MAGSKGNAGGTGKKSAKGPEIVQRARSILLRTFEIYEDEAGKTIPEVIVDHLLKHETPVPELMRMLDLYAKFSPKDLNIEIDDGPILSDTEREQRILAILERARPGGAGVAADPENMGAASGPTDSSVKH